MLGVGGGTGWGVYLEALRVLGKAHMSVGEGEGQMAGVLRVLVHIHPGVELETKQAVVLMARPLGYRLVEVWQAVELVDEGLVHMALLKEQVGLCTVRL